MQDDFIVAGDVPEESAWTAQLPWGKGDILECVIIAAMQDLVDQDPKRSIRSLKINAKENMKVLKEAVEPRKKGLLLDSSM